MKTNDKTLADVQPGGRVRLETVPYDRARDLIGDAYNAGTHGIGYSQQAMELHDAIIPAQPSPGGQDALAALQQDYDKLLDSFNRQVEVAEKIAGRVLQQNDRIEELEDTLAARQPVGQEPVAPKKMARTVALDLMHAVYEHHGWKRAEGESMTARVNALYDVTLDAGRNRFVATPKPAAPPAQAVDLGQLPRYSKSYSEGIYLDDAGDWVRFADVLALIDSQAVGNG